MFCKQLLSLFGFETQFRASMAANFHYVNRSRVYLRFRNSNEIELLIFRLCNLSCYNLAAWNKPKKADVMTSPGIPRYLIQITRNNLVCCYIWSIYFKKLNQLNIRQYFTPFKTTKNIAVK